MAGRDEPAGAPRDGPGPLLASGRAADVFDLGDGTVLRRYRDRRHDPGHEARVMTYIGERGVDVPRVLELSGDHDPATDIVMEKIDGITMLADLEQRPWMVVGHARRLARLQQEIGGIVAPDWMMSPGWTPRSDGDAAHVDRVVHLDLHPLNVIMSRRGPIVIDWTNATGGPPGFDAAMSYVIMATYEVDNPRDRLAQQVMVSTFRRAAGRRRVDAFLGAACDHRLADAFLTPGERVNVAALRARITRSG